MEKEFKDLVREQRKKIGKTLEEVATAVGVGKATVQRWESGAIKDVRRDKLVKLAMALETTPAYLMGWAPPKWEQDCLDDYWKSDREGRLKLIETYGVCDEVYWDYMALIKDPPKAVQVPSIHLTAHEKELILSYRSHPEMQAAVDTLLGLTPATPATKNA